MNLSGHARCRSLFVSMSAETLRYLGDRAVFEKLPCLPWPNGMHVHGRRSAWWYFTAGPLSKTTAVDLETRLLSGHALRENSHSLRRHWCWWGIVTRALGVNFTARLISRLPGPMPALYAQRFGRPNSTDWTRMDAAIRSTCVARVGGPGRKHALVALDALIRRAELIREHNTQLTRRSQ